MCLFEIILNFGGKLPKAFFVAADKNEDSNPKRYISGCL